ncbi:hypothetical protein SNM59_24150, partial [Klebsiella pneumoniae]|nr:hypothetical protein [Klebsiella pneumoniae]
MSSLSIRSFTLFREEQPVRDALVLFTLTLLLHFLGAMLRLVQELSFFWPLGNDSNLLIVFYVQIMPDDFVMQLHR